MNFFGHALVACWVDRSAPWVLGSMLPDFASMSRARLLGADDPRVSAGIEWHHATDDVFHRTATFVEVYVAGGEELERQGIDHGASIAIGHVGTELLIDGLLIDDPAVAAAYLAALELVGDPSMGVRWHGDGADRYRVLGERMRQYGMPDDYRSPMAVAHRLHRILVNRPRLAITQDQVRAIVPWLERTRAELERRLPELLTEIRDGLAEHPLGARLGGVVESAEGRP